MFKISLANISTLILLFIAAFTIAVVTPPITSRAETAPMSSLERARLLSDWQQQVAAWQKVSKTAAATTTTGNMLGSQVAVLPKTGFIADHSDSLTLNLFKAVLISFAAGALIVYIRSQLWRTIPYLKRG